MKIIDIESAHQMYEAMDAEFAAADIVIKTAEVADYRPKQIHTPNVKKQDGDLAIELEHSIDILAALGDKKATQRLIDFTVGPNDIEAYAQRKLFKQKLDYMIVNVGTEQGLDFGTETNRVTLFGKEDFKQTFPQLQKKDLALALLTAIAEREQTP